MGGSARLPLNVVCVVDGSDSISAHEWNSAMRANKELITDFEDVYSSDQGKLNFGFVQFSDESRVELPITDNLPSVLTMLDGMQQAGGLTYYDKALKLCKQQLASYTAAGPDALDICVFITDGWDMSKRSSGELQRLVDEDTAIFGIFVGDDPQGQNALKNIVKPWPGCEEHGHREARHGHACDFFASATDFAALAARTREVAEGVTHGSDLTLCAMHSAMIEAPVLLGLILPCVLWYFSCCAFTVAKRRLDRHNNDGSNFNYQTVSKDENLKMLMAGA